MPVSLEQLQLLTLFHFSLTPCPSPSLSPSLPPSLSPSLFPSHSAHENALKQHERARKLHWTLHGWASVHYDGLNLSVTTVQMIILLFFNTNEVCLFLQGGQFGPSPLKCPPPKQDPNQTQ